MRRGFCKPEACLAAYAQLASLIVLPAMAVNRLEAPPPSLRRPSSQRDDLVHTLLKVVLGVFAGTIAFSLAGMLLLKLVPSALSFFGPYLFQLIRTPTWIYMMLLPVLPVLMYGRSLGWKRMLFFFCWGSAVGAASELVGTNVGVPFGAYYYTDLLGPKIMGDVPYFIPPSWFAMSVISLDLARRVVRRWAARVLTGSFFMVLWDVALDPAMSVSSPLSPVFWSYPEGGFFYGMPLSNWLGWLLVALVIMLGYELIGGGLRASHPWAPWIYLLNGAFPLLTSLLMGLYGAALAGAVALSIPLLAVWQAGRRRATPSASLST